VILTLVAVLAPFVLFAQTSIDVVARRTALEQQLDQIENEIKTQETFLQQKQQEHASLERDISILNANINKAKLSIKARTIEINNLTDDINGKAMTITSLGRKMDREMESLAEFLRKTNEIDRYSLPEMILANKTISDFFSDVESFSSINQSLRDSFSELRSTKQNTEEEKANLEAKRQEKLDLKRIQELEQKKIMAQEKEKQNLLAITKGKESEYQKIIKKKAESATAIRNELFTLIGSTAIPFEKALEYANLAGKKMGVRTAVILGIIAEESNLGENVGKGNWRIDMKDPRDTVPFKDICSRLGLDPDKMPVSKKAWYGYGGAMGPAQFIPSTWILFEKRIAEATGHNPPNPWNPEDAFMATAILMKDNGANKQTYAAERLAAIRYLAGWANASKKAYAFYGDDVMELAAKSQRQIDILRNN